MNTYTTNTSSYPVKDIQEIKQKVLNWAKQFDTFCFLDSHQYLHEAHNYECILAAGTRRSISLNAGSALQELQSLIEEEKTWLFGHLGYDLKQELGFEQSSNTDNISFPDLHFFQPEVLIRFGKEEMVIDADDPEKIFESVHQTPVQPEAVSKTGNLRYRIQKEEYISIVEKLRGHILRGDCYEINFCQEVYSDNADVDPVHLYHKLAQVSPNPFSCLYRMKERWLICASPERFLAKRGQRIISQPIKGTSRRFETSKDDVQSRESLKSSKKDRSENVMVVDLVRNDLSRICKEGSVNVDELYGIYSFPQVHQMISTVSGELNETASFKDIIGATFPMGSMTGAPKKKVIELIEHYEKTKRGIFSGAVGYIDPSGDFDFNVVIRSLMYNQSNHYLSFQVGSGITFYSDPVKEFEECEMKAEAMLLVIR